MSAGDSPQPLCDLLGELRRANPDDDTCVLAARRLPPDDTARTAERAPRGSGSFMAARALVVGILNCTPDSFHDRGRQADRDALVARGLQMAEEDAD